MVVSARATGAEAIDGFLLAQRVADLGELSMQARATGYPNTGRGVAEFAGLFCPDQLRFGAD